MNCPNCGYDNVMGEDYCTSCKGDLRDLDLPEPHDEIEKGLMEDPVGTLAPPIAATVDAKTSLETVIKQLAKDRRGSLLVTQDGKLVGIFTERDVLVKVAGIVDNLAATAVEEVMTTNPETVKPTDTIAYALNKMYLGGYRHLPVMDDDKPLGIISMRDVLGYIARTFPGALGTSSVHRAATPPV